MPKKTRQEKIIAELRRKLRVSETPIPKSSETTEKIKSPTVTYKPSYTPVKSTSIPAQDISLVLKDLRKTFILAGLAISFEIIVYFIWK